MRGKEGKRRVWVRGNLVTGVNRCVLTFLFYFFLNIQEEKKEKKNKMKKKKKIETRKINQIGKKRN